MVSFVKKLVLSTLTRLNETELNKLNIIKIIRLNLINTFIKGKDMFKRIKTW